MSLVQFRHVFFCLPTPGPTKRKVTKWTRGRPTLPDSPFIGPSYELRVEASKPDRREVGRAGRPHKIGTMAGVSRAGART